MPASIPSPSRGRRLRIPREAWTSDRIGRLITGGVLLALMLLALAQCQAAVWCAIAAAMGMQLVLTSLLGWCPIHELLRGLGCKDREEVYAESIAQPRVNNARVLESQAVHESDEALDYDRMVQKYKGLLNDPFVSFVSKRVGAKKKLRVVDLGTGPGWICIRLAQMHPDWEFWAVDLSEDMLTQGRKHSQEAGVSDRIHFVRGDARYAPLEDGKFDLVLSHFLLHHLEQPESLFREASRLAGPNGRVLIKDLCRPSPLKARFLLWFSRHFLGYGDTQLKMYRESLQAAFTIPEIRASLMDSPLTQATVKSFRGLDLIIEAQ